MKRTGISPLLASVIGLGLLGQSASGQVVALTDFTGGTDGWGGNGGAELTHNNGNDYFRIPGVTSMFWFEFWNDSNPAWIGDYTAKGDLLEFSVDVQTNFIAVNGNPVDSRAVIFELRNYDMGDDFYPYASVMFEMGRVSGFAQEWTNYSVTFDPNSAVLPEGWRAYGAEDKFGNWTLPQGVTFAELISGVDEIVIHSAELGFFYPFTVFDLSIDNIMLRNVPSPGTLAVLCAPALFARRRRVAG